MSAFLFLIGLAVFCWGLVDLRRQARHLADTARETPERLSRMADELVAAAEEAAAAMRQRSDALTDLVQVADDRLAALRSSLARAEATEAPSAPAGRAAGAQRTRAAAAVAQVQADADAEFTPVDLAAPKPTRGRRTDVSMVRQQVERAALMGKSDSAHQHVWQLADAGLTSTAIAKQLGLSKGEVEMILGLRKMGAEGAGA